MGLSDSERVQHTTFGLNKIYQNGKELNADKDYTYRAYEEIKKMSMNVWNTWFTSNSAYWITGSDFKVEHSSSNPFGIALEETISYYSKDKKDREWDDLMEKENSDEIDLISIAKELRYNPVEKVLLIADGIQKAKYGIGRYDDEFSEAKQKTMDYLSTMEGEIFGLMHKEKMFALVYEIQEVANIIARNSLLKYAKNEHDGVTKLLMSECSYWADNLKRLNVWKHRSTYNDEIKPEDALEELIGVHKKLLLDPSERNRLLAYLQLCFISDKQVDKVMEYAKKQKWDMKEFSSLKGKRTKENNRIEEERERIQKVNYNPDQPNEHITSGKAYLYQIADEYYELQKKMK